MYMCTIYFIVLRIGKGGMLTVCIPNAAIWQKKEHIYKIIDTDGHATAADDDRRMPGAK